MTTYDTRYGVDRRAVLGGAAAVAGSSLLPPAARAANLPLTFEIPTRSGASWPLYLALEGKYFEKYGIDPKIVFGVHPAGIAMVMSGEAAMTNYGLEQVVAAVAREPALVMMGSSLNKAQFGMIVRPEITSIAQLKGKRIGVGRVGDPPYFYTLDLISKFGLGPRDVQWISVPADATARAGVLLAGQVDASLITAPSYYKLETKGLKLLDNTARHPELLISTAYTFKKSWVDSHRDLPAKIIMAQAEAIKRFYDDKAFAIEAYIKNDPQDKADVERYYDDFVATDTLDRIPLLSKAAVSAAADRLVADIPNVKSLDLQKGVDLSDVRKLISDGFFEKLFGPGIKAEQDAKLKDAFA